MSDAGRELVELKREIIEARNQAIKTDNQVKNLALDVKGFEKRFDGLEKRARFSSIGVNLLVAGTVFGATYAVGGLRARTQEARAEQILADVEDTRQASQKRVGDLKQQLASMERQRSEQERAGSVVTEILGHLDARRDKEAAELLRDLNLQALSDLERKLVEKRVTDLSKRAADTAYRSARNLLTAGRPDAAIADLRRVVQLEPEGRHAGAARYLLSTNLWSLKRWDEAEPALRDAFSKESDKSVRDELRYLLAISLAQLGRREDARAMFGEAIAAGGRYEKTARSHLAALEAGEEMPSSRAGRAPRRTAGEATASATDTATE